MKMRHISGALVAIALAAATALPAHAADFLEMFSPVYSIGYYGQQTHGKVRNGMAIMKRGNDIYFGDVFGGEPDGKGVLICKKPGSLGMKEAAIYAGEWFNGKRTGNGRLYDQEGRLLYDGTFDGNKTQTPGALDPDRHFSIKETSDRLCLGEYAGDTPQGLSCDLVKGSTKYIVGEKTAGKFLGVTLMVWGPDDWQLNYAYGWRKDEVCSNPQFYASVEGERIEQQKRDWDEAKGAFAQAAVSATQLAADIHSHGRTAGATSIDIDETSSSSSSSGGTASRSGSSKASSSKSSSSKASGASKGKGGAWLNSMSRSYSDYETQVVKISTGDRSGSDLASIQSKMKEIREKVLAAGYHLTQSQWETWRP